MGTSKSAEGEGPRELHGQAVAEGMHISTHGQAVAEGMHISTRAGPRFK